MSDAIIHLAADVTSMPHPQSIQCIGVTNVLACVYCSGRFKLTVKPNL